MDTRAASRQASASNPAEVATRPQGETSSLAARSQQMLGNMRFRRCAQRLPHGVWASSLSDRGPLEAGRCF
eukprot:13804150-Alexandrium_andersonii.AAC.1